MTDFVLIDGNNLLYRSHFSRPAQWDNRGAVHGIIGLVDMILRRHRNWKPKQMVVCWDAQGKTFRHELYPAYKAHRKATPEELLVQIPRAKKALENLGISQIEVPGFEADDCIGTLASQIEQQGLLACIVSGDRDLWQLISRNVTLEYLAVKKPIQMLTLFRFGELYRIDPGQILDYKAIVGDSSDNIPGVPGIGDKTIWPLLQQGIGLKELLEFPGFLSPRHAKLLKTYQDQAILSRKLAEIRRDIPISLPAETKVNFYSPQSLKTLKALGLRQISA